MTAASASSGYVPKTDSNFSSASSYLAFLQHLFQGKSGQLEYQRDTINTFSSNLEIQKLVLRP
jgi:hypothetical protein